jgi:two-component system response regulator RegA
MERTMNDVAAGREEQPGLLVVEDNKNLGERLARALSTRGFQVSTARTVDEVKVLAGQTPAAFALVDLKLPDGYGLRLVSTLLGLDPRTRVVVLTGYGSLATAVDAIRMDASEHVAKPANADDIELSGQRAQAREQDAEHKPMSLARLEWEYIQQVLRENNGNVSATARALSMHRRTLQRKLAKRPVRR